MTGVIRKVFGRFGVQMTQKKLGQAVPVVGILVGAGLNAATINGVTEAAEMVYRERFLREKYGLPETDDQRVAQQEDVVDVTEILEAEIVQDAEREPDPVEERPGGSDVVGTSSLAAVVLQQQDDRLRLLTVSALTRVQLDKAQDLDAPLDDPQAGVGGLDIASHGRVPEPHL